MHVQFLDACLTFVYPHPYTPRGLAPSGAVEKEVAAIALRSWDWLPHANLEAVMGLIILCLIIF